MRIFVITKKVLIQLIRNKRFLALSLIAPLVIIYFLKLFLDSLPSYVNEIDYLIPVTAFVMHFLGLVLCMIALVQERSAGTLQRMFVSGYRKIEILTGYAIGYMFLGTIQTLLAIFEANYLFSLNYSFATISKLFAIIWILVFVSVMLGIFISTFARNESEVFPFIPLFLLPSVFLSGMIISIDKLPDWAQVLGKIFPMYYANDALQNTIIKSSSTVFSSSSFFILIGYGLLLILLASFTLKE